MNPEQMQKEIERLNNELANFRGEFDQFVLHEHTGFDSSPVRIEHLDEVFYKPATIDPGSLVDGAGSTHSVTGVTGATLGDFVLVSAPYDLQDITVTAYIQANDTVEIRIQNESGSTVDLASGTWRVLVIRKIV